MAPGDRARTEVALADAQVDAARDTAVPLDEPTHGLVEKLGLESVADEFRAFAA
ncbi:MAG: hypothetical protein ABI345_07220 [Jatrophihabitans sp.]